MNKYIFMFSERERAKPQKISIHIYIYIYIHAWIRTNPHELQTNGSHQNESIESNRITRNCRIDSICLCFCCCCCCSVHPGLICMDLVAHATSTMQVKISRLRNRFGKMFTSLRWKGKSAERSRQIWRS